MKNELIMGYLVTYCKSKGLFEGYEEEQKVITSKAKLAEMLKSCKYYVLSAISVPVQEYQKNHTEKLEIWQ